MKHYKSVEFLSNVNVKAPLHKCKAPRTNGKPYWRLSGDGSGLTAVPAYFKKSAKLFVVVRYFVPDIGVKVKLSEFKSLQVKLLQYIAKIATYSKQDMNHICLLRLVVLKRPGFQSRKYGMPMNAWTAISASRCGYHVEDGRWCDCKRIVMFKYLCRNYGTIVVWCNRSRKFLVFNHAKLPEIGYTKLCLF